MPPPEAPCKGGILVVTRHYAPEPTGSAPVIQQMAEWLAADGAQVKVVTVRPNYPEARILPGYERGQHDKVVEGGVQVRRWPTTPVKGSGLLARAGAEIRFLLQLLSRRGGLRPSLQVISLCPSILTVLGALSLRARGGRHVTIVHDVQSGLGGSLGVGWLVTSILRRVEVWTLNRVDHLIVLSTSMGRVLVDMGVRTPFSVAPPQVDARALTPRPEPPGRLTLMYSGNLGRKQGLHSLLALAALLQMEAPDVVILIRGDGAIRAELVERAAAAGLTNVIFEALVAREEVARSLSEGHVHLIPQLPGGHKFAVPSKVFSIMAAGRPFVATADIGSPLHDLAQGVGAGLAVPTGDTRAFADAAVALLRDPARRRHMGDLGRAWVEQEADTPVVMARIAALLRGSQPLRS